MKPAPAAWLIGVAASAGGIPALEILLAGLPADLPASVLVVQHLADRPPGSRLAQILSRHTGMRVTPAQQGDDIRNGVVYVAEPGRHLAIGRDLRIQLARTELVHFVRPSADVLFASMAQVGGERVIAVVLTGTGSDGADGALAIHNAGGIVIAQDEASSANFGMPRSAIRAGAVDYVLPLPDIPSRLIELVATHVDF